VICADLPRTLVHGDLVAKNLRLRRDAAGPAIVALDWEWSGWGVPAADLHLLAQDTTGSDLLAYRSAMSGYTRALDDDQVRLLALVGNSFRLLACVDWVTPHLRYPWPEAAMTKLRAYEQPLGAWAAALESAA
jgi:thiamine kinase-like enzyme